MKLKEGMYVRTKDGYLHTILGISEHTGRPYHTDKDNLGNYIELDNISKCEEFIEDLIEVGDYVNGHKVEQIWEDNQRFGGCDYMFNIHIDNVKSIVTKEHFESVSYKLEDDK